MADNVVSQGSDNGLDFDKFAVRTKDGSVDIQQTHTRFTQELHQFIQSERMDNEVIAAAVQRAFTTHNVKTLPMGAVLQYTMEMLNVSPSDYSMIKERVQKYVRNNVNRYKVAKGKGGGVSWLDQETIAPIGTSVAPPSGSIRPRAPSAS